MHVVINNFAPFYGPVFMSAYSVVMWLVCHESLWIFISAWGGENVGFYELVKDRGTPEGYDARKPPAWVVWWAASTAGFCYWSMTYPTDVIKSSMQSDESDHSRRRFAGIQECIRKLYVEDGGWRRFFRGLTPCLLRSIPANVTMLYVVDRSRHFLDPYL